MQKVYLDNAATTKVRDEVVEAMLPYFTEYFGNPSSLHLFAREAGKGLDTARAGRKSIECKAGRDHFYRRRQRKR